MQASRYKWVLVGMLWLICLFNYADRQAIFSVFPVLKTELGLTDVQLGMVGSSFMWVYAAMGPVAGVIGDRVSRKALILGGLIFWSAVTLATALAHSYEQLLACRALEGLGEAFYFPASMSLISEYHGQDTRSRAMAIHQSSVYAGTILGGALSGYLAQAYGWRIGFYVFGSAGILLGVALMMLLREPSRNQADSTQTLNENRLDFAGLGALLSNRSVLGLIAVFIGANFVAMVFLTWMPAFLHNKFHMSLAMAGLNASAYLQIASVLGVLSGGLLADTLARRGSAGRMQTQLIGLLGGVPFLFAAGQTAAVPTLVIALTGFGFFKGLYDANIWASLYDVVSPRQRATAVGFMNSLGWLGGGSAPVIIAAASERFGWSASISATAAVYLLAAMILVLVIRVARPSRAGTQTATAAVHS